MTTSSSRAAGSDPVRNPTRTTRLTDRRDMAADSRMAWGVAPFLTQPRGITTVAKNSWAASFEPSQCGQAFGRILPNKCVDHRLKFAGHHLGQVERSLG